MIQNAIAKVVDRIDLTEAESESAMREVMEGAATPAQIAAYMTALRMKGETAEEITGSARVMREKSFRLHVAGEEIADTCGTGGDGHGTFNISTTVAFVVAGCGVTVAKHGNRAVSSACGSADVLKALGVNIDLPPQQVEEVLRTIHIAFLYAPLFHGAMKHAALPRREVGIRSIFNLLGPLTNPAGASLQLIGVASPHLTHLIAQVLLNLDCRHGFVVHGAGGADEITLMGPTAVAEVKARRIISYTLEPESFGLSSAPMAALSGGSAEENAKIMLAILEGERGPRRDVVLINAAPLLVAAGKARTLKEGVAQAAYAIASKAALQKLNLLREMTHQLSPSA